MMMCVVLIELAVPDACVMLNGVKKCDVCEMTCV